MSHRVVCVLALSFLVGSLLFGLAVHLSNPVLPDDDAYITYRYSDNLLNGRGLVYNPGQRVFGSSTPLYVVWLAGLRAVVRSVPTPDLAVRVNFVFYALTGLGAFCLLMSLSGSPALAAVFAGLLVIRSSLLRASLCGMETFLFTGLLVWSLWALTTRRYGLGAWLAGLSVLARPEGVLVAAVFFASWLRARRNWHELVGLLLPGVVWTVIATAYFGTPVYHSIVAKSRPLYPLPAGAALRKLISQVVLWTTGGWTSLSADALAACLILLVLMLAIAVFGYVQKLRSRVPGAGASNGQPDSSHWTAEVPGPHPLLRGRRAGVAVDDALAVPLLAGLFVAFYAATNPLMQSWYFPPVDCLWFIALASGTVFAAAWLKDRCGPGLGLVPVLALLALFSGSALLPMLKRTTAGRPATDLKLQSSPILGRTVVYRAAAEWLNRHAPPGETLVAMEIGALGYYHRGHVYDACGLVSPEALPFLPAPASERAGPNVGAIPLELVKHLRCDIVVTMQMFARRSLYSSDWFRQNYTLAQQFRLPLQCWGAGGDTIDIYFSRGGRAGRE